MVNLLVTVGINVDVLRLTVFLFSVHSFLKDSDHVLKNYEKTQTEDKCLLLIRKPKSASKQVNYSEPMSQLFKTVSFSDMGKGVNVISCI